MVGIRIAYGQSVNGMLRSWQSNSNKTRLSGGHSLRKVAAVVNKSGGVDTNKKSVGKATGNMETCEGERTVKEPHMAGRCVV